MHLAPSSQSGALPFQPVCKIGNSSAQVAAALISPGLYQFNITVPGDASSGDDTPSCTYNNANTPTGDLITVK